MPTTILSPYHVHPHRTNVYAPSCSSIDTSEQFKVASDASALVPHGVAFAPFGAQRLTPAGPLKTLRSKVSRSFRKPKPVPTPVFVPVLAPAPAEITMPPRAFVVIRPDDADGMHTEADQSLSGSLDADTTLMSDATPPDIAWREQIFSLVAESLSAHAAPSRPHFAAGAPPGHINVFGTVNPLSVGAAPIPTLPQRRSFLSLRGTKPADLPLPPAAVAKPAWTLTRQRVRRASSWDSPTLDRIGPICIPPPSPSARVDIAIDAQLDDFLELITPPNVGITNPFIKPTIPAKSEVVKSMRFPLRRMPLVNKPLPPTPQEAPSLPYSAELGLIDHASVDRPKSPCPVAAPQPRTMKLETLTNRAKVALSLNLSDSDNILIESLEGMPDERHVLSEETRLARARAVTRSLMNAPAPLRPTSSDSARGTRPAPPITRGKENVTRATGPAASHIPVRKSSLWESLKQKSTETMSLSPNPTLTRPSTPRCKIVITPPAEDRSKEYEWKS
jgi:hypothetical protein